MSSPLLIQMALQSGRKLDHTCEAFKINTSKSKRYPNLVQFKYDQLASDMTDMLVRQCRGVILDEKNNWACVARPFDKFFNIEEERAAKIDWASARVQEKLDGSLMIMYYYDYGWHIATSGICDASGPVGDPYLSNMTFHDLFWRTFSEKKYIVPTAWKAYTFMFELMTPYNKVVVQHKVCDLKLIGLRHTSSGTEWPLSTVKGMFEPTITYSFNNLDQIIETFNTMKPLEQEGYVVIDKHWNRVKIKHPGYVALHHMRSAFSLRYAVELVRKGDIDEIIAYFPEWKELLLSIRSKYETMIADIYNVYGSIKDITDQKEFAVKAGEYAFAGILFWLRSGKFKTVQEGLNQMHIDRLIRLLKLDKDQFSVTGNIKESSITTAA